MTGFMLWCLGCVAVIFAYRVGQYRGSRSERRIADEHIVKLRVEASMADLRAVEAVESAVKALDLAQQVNDGIAQHGARNRADEAVAFHVALAKRARG